MTQAVPSRLHPRLRRTASSVVGEWNRIGSQAQFYGKTLDVDSRCRHQLPDRAVAADRADGIGC